MQQVFENVIVTLQKDPETRKRNLGIRTYKIIPLTSQTGVIQWVDNTIPFGSYLTDKDKSLGAHSRYRPEDWTHAQCRDHLRAADRAGQPHALREIYSRLAPAFRFFFVENFADTVQWLSARGAYTRSVAVLPFRFQFYS
jgi:ataxia telangiectasia mutated family protein